jgi:hypothetical protein
MLELIQRRAFFDSYAENVGRLAPSFVAYGLRFTCPCCGYPTLEERGIYEICFLCWWEDDGQDDRDADEVRGGPNGRYSLTQARLNFIHHRVMYEPEHNSRVRPDSQEELAAKRRVIRAFDEIQQSPPAGHERHWEDVRAGMTELQRLR